MLIGLYNLEPTIVNTALMQVSTYYKKLGDYIELYKPYNHHEYDKVYAFSIFKHTPKNYVRKGMIKGGTGFDVQTKLPKEIEDCDYDWSLYPDCDFSIIWFSRGCIRNCQWCVVREKEGMIHPVEPKNLNPSGKYIVVADNNFFANPKWREAIEQLKKWNQPVDFQGIDARILTDEMCMELNNLVKFGNKKYNRKQIKIAWDDPKDDIIPHITRMLKYMKAYKIMCYVLIGFNSTPAQDLYRVLELRKLNIAPFVMPYHKSDDYQKAFVRWVNHKAIFKTVDWADYKGGVKNGKKN